MVGKSQSTRREHANSTPYLDNVVGFVTLRKSSVVSVKQISEEDIRPNPQGTEDTPHHANSLTCFISWELKTKPIIQLPWWKYSPEVSADTLVLYYCSKVSDLCNMQYSLDVGQTQVLFKVCLSAYFLMKGTLKAGKWMWDSAESEINEYLQYKNTNLHIFHVFPQTFSKWKPAQSFHCWLFLYLLQDHVCVPSPAG